MLRHQAILRCTHADATSLPTLYEKIVENELNGEAPVSISTFRSIVEEMLTEQDLVLLGISQDHNKVDRVPAPPTHPPTCLPTRPPSTRTPPERHPNAGLWLSL